jgi:lipopolysaccharide transport system permease protein
MTDLPVTVIEARPKTLAARLYALWQYRSFHSLLVKEITLKQVRGTLLGVWWLIIRPLIPALVAVVTFTFILPVQTHGLPYVIFLLSGYMTWQLFQATLVFVPRTLQWMRGLMRRTYFPKLLVPMASIGPPLVEFVILLTLFAVALIYIYVSSGTLHLRVGWEMLWFPVCLFLAMTLGVAIGMTLSVIVLFIRDVIFTVRYVAQLMIFVTPVLYPASLLSEPWRSLIYILNPMAQFVEVSRWSLTGYGDFQPLFLALSIAINLVIIALSVAFFMRAETYLADEI